MTFRSMHDRVVVIRTNAIPYIADDNLTGSFTLLAHNPPDAPDTAPQHQLYQ